MRARKISQGNILLLLLEICGSWSPINAIFEPNSKWILVFWAQQERRPQNPRQIFHSFYIFTRRTIDFSLPLFGARKMWPKSFDVDDDVQLFHLFISVQEKVKVVREIEWSSAYKSEPLPAASLACKNSFTLWYARVEITFECLKGIIDGKQRVPCFMHKDDVNFFWSICRLRRARALTNRNALICSYVWRLMISAKSERILCVCF